MRKTLYLLLTHYGDHQCDYAHFFFENRALLRAEGIACPWLDGVAPGRSWTFRLTTKLAAVANGSPEAVAELRESLEGCNGILLALPVDRMSRVLQLLLPILRGDPAFSAWADAEVRVVWLARDRASDAEGNVLFDLPRDAAADVRRASLEGAKTWFAQLDDILGLAAKPAILEDTGAEHVPMAQILEKLGISLPLENAAPLREAWPLSLRALWCLVRFETILPYGTPASRLPLDAVFPRGDDGGFLTPDTLAALHAAYTDGMKERAANHGSELTLPPPQPAEDWHPFLPPAAEDCRKVYEAYLGSVDQDEREFSLRLLENAWDTGWLCDDAAAYAARLRAAYGIPQPEAPLLTVLTLTRDHEKYIGSCIDSVLTQKTTFPVRHVIVDDVSTDGTRPILERYARKHPSICPVFMAKGRSVGDNVRALFSRCSSTYAALCDGDDYFSDNEKLQRQVDFLEANPDCSICFHPVIVHFENRTHVDFIFPPPKMLPRSMGKRYYLADLAKGNFIQTNSVVYRWRFREGVPDWFRGDICPGDWYWHMLHAETGKIGFMPRIMSVYRRHGSAMYMDSFSRPDKHWRNHGMDELRAFHVFNEHFNGRYFRPLSRLANQVLASFLADKMAGIDTGLFDEACTAFPEFGVEFLKNLDISALRRSVPAKGATLPDGAASQTETPSETPPGDGRG